MRGDLLWAKEGIFPWWPVVVRDASKATDADDPELRVLFLHTNDDYWMPKDKLAAWASMPEVLRYGGKSKAIRRQWHAALAEAKAPRDASIEAKWDAEDAEEGEEGEEEAEEEASEEASQEVGRRRSRRWPRRKRRRRAS